MQFSTKPITNRIVTIKLNQKIGFLKKFSCLSFSSFDKDIFDKKEKSRYKIFPKNKAIKAITKTKR